MSTCKGLDGLLILMGIGSLQSHAALYKVMLLQFREYFDFDLPK